MLSTVPLVRLSRAPLPTCHETAAETGKALRGVISRGCQPHHLLLCLSGGNERRRHEQGLSVLSTLSDAPNELTVVHLGGIPLTPQSARGLKALFLAASPAVPPTKTAATATPKLPPLQPDLPPLRLFLYGYDLTRQPASVALEMLAAAAATRLSRLEFWGCVGWPKRLHSALQMCSRLQHLAMSFPPLVDPSAVNAAGVTAALHGPHNHHIAGMHPSTAACAAASGAVAMHNPVTAAATAAAVVRCLGALRQLRSLELRGCSLNLSRPGSVTAASRASGRSGSKAAAARHAEEAVSPTPQQLACALFQLTGLTRLLLEGLPTVTPLLSTLSTLRGLRSLELPDVTASPKDMAAIAAAVPRLQGLALASVGQGAVLGLRDASERAAVAASRPPEPLALPADLTTLHVVRNRPTLRTMRALRLAVEARVAGAVRPVGGGAAELTVVVPGVEIDMPDVEFDPLLAFHRAEDGVMRSTLLPDSVEALVAALRLLAPPPPPLASSSSRPWCSPPSPASSLSGALLGASGAFMSTPTSIPGGGCATTATAGGDGGANAVCAADFLYDAEPAFLQVWQQELVIHNVQGSLEPPAAASRSSSTHGTTNDSGTGTTNGHAGGGMLELSAAAAVPDLVPGGHAVWIREMRRLGLQALELYGIGLEVGDFAALAELLSLQRLALVAGELALEALPSLAALPHLQYLELARCTPRRRTRTSKAGDDGCGAGAGPEGDPSGRIKRALLELCVSAPALQRVLVVRSAGNGCVSSGLDGPLGAEWVRQQLRVMAPRQGQGHGKAAGEAEKETDAGGRGWPEVTWD